MADGVSLELPTKYARHTRRLEQDLLSLLRRVAFFVPKTQHRWVYWSTGQSIIIGGELMSTA